MAKHYGIDPGTSYIRILSGADGTMMRAPSAVALDKRSREVVALGGDAKRMLGKSPSNVIACKPFCEGLVDEYDAAERMIAEYFRRLRAVTLFGRPKILASVPLGISDSGQMLAENVMFEAGAKSVAVVEAPLAAAVGAGLRVTAAKACMIADLGGGMSEIAVICSGGIVSCGKSKVSGDRFDTLLRNYIKQKKDLIIGDITAEYIKKELASAIPGTDRGELRISGLNVRTGFANTVIITSHEVYEATRGLYNSLARSILSVIEDTPPDIAGDIFDFGIMLTGGLSLIPGIDRFISDVAKIRVTVAKNPLDCTVTGLGRLMKSPSLVGDVIRYRSR